MPSLSSKSKPAATSGAPPKHASLNSSGRKIIRYRGHQHLRQRLILSILSGKSVRIDGIREDEVEVGLKDYEVSLLRLLEKITNGTTIEISYTGTTVLVHPGLLPGGSYTHTCPLTRPIGYFLETLLVLGPFGKRPLDVRLEGITGEEGKDMSVDMLRTVGLPTLHLFGIIEGLELQIKRRGAAPLGGGLVIFKCPVVKNVKTLDFVDAGKIKRIRGIAYSTRVSPQFANRMVEAARSVLNRYIPDIYLYTDVYKGEESGKSPGYGLTLLSQSTTSALHTAETISVPAASRSNPSDHGTAPEQAFQTPEDLALNAARALLEQVSRGGCVDEAYQWLVCLLMILGTEDVARCRMGSLTPLTVQWLRDINDFFGVRFNITPIAQHHAGNIKQTAPNENVQEKGEDESSGSDDDEDNERVIGGVKVKGVVDSQNDKVKRLVPDEVMVSCVGIGYGNINRSTA